MKQKRISYWQDKSKTNFTNANRIYPDLQQVVEHIIKRSKRYEIIDEIIVYGQATEWTCGEDTPVNIYLESQYDLGVDILRELKRNKKNPHQVILTTKSMLSEKEVKDIYKNGVIVLKNEKD